MNIHVQAFVWMYVFTSCDYMLKIWIERLCDSSIFNILRNYKTISKLAAPFYILTSNVWGFQFLYILIKTCYIFYCSYPSRYKVVSIVIFICTSLRANGVDHY